MKLNYVLPAFTALNFVLTPFAVHGFDGCRLIFAKNIKPMIEADLNYTLAKQDGGKKLLITMESASPENLQLIRQLLRSWNMKMDKEGYQAFQKSFFVVRDYLGIHEFNKIVSFLAKIDGDANTVFNRVVDIAYIQAKFIDIAFTSEGKQIISSPHLNYATRIEKINHENGWSKEQLHHYLETAIELKNVFEPGYTNWTSVEHILANFKHFDDYKLIKDLRLRYIEQDSYRKTEHTIHENGVDLSQADVIIKYASDNDKSVAEVVRDLKETITKLGLNDLAVVEDRVQITDLLPKPEEKKPEPEPQLSFDFN